MPTGSTAPTPATAAGVAALLVLSLVVGGCSDDDGAADSGTTTSAVTADSTADTTAATTTSAPTTTAAAASSTADTIAPTGPPAADQVPDGTSFGFVTAVDLEASTITIDIAELLSGDDAVKAAIEDGVLEPGETSIDNDYYIRNKNPKVRVAPVSGTATLKVLVNPGSPDPTDGTFAQLADHVAERATAEAGLPVQIVAAGGVVSRIDEVFFP